jgi:CNT family concentrative nucleoside transporter
MPQLQSAFGVLALLAIAWALGENRRAVSLRQMAIGLAVTIVTALVLLKLPPVAKAFGAINDAVNTIAAATRAGTSFVFGYLGGGALPFDLKAPGADFILAFQALPIVLVMSVLTTLLFYWRVLPPVVRGMAWLLERTLGVGGAVGLSTAANIFLGMVEAPLFIRPYLAQLTRSELFLVMTGGMAGIAGTVLVLYATFLAPMIPDAAAHFVIASVLGAPAGRWKIPTWTRHRPWTPSPRAPQPGSNCCSTSSQCCWCWWRWSISPTPSSGCCPRSAAPGFRCSACSGF